MADEPGTSREFLDKLLAGKFSEAPEHADMTIDWRLIYENRFHKSFEHIKLVVPKELFDAYLRILDDGIKNAENPDEIDSFKAEQATLRAVLQTKKQYILNYAQAIDAFNHLDATLGEHRREQLLDGSRGSESARYFDGIIGAHCAILDAFMPNYDDEIEPWEFKVDPKVVTAARDALAAELFKANDVYNVAWGDDSAQAIADKVVNAARQSRQELLGEAPTRDSP